MPIFEYRCADCNHEFERIVLTRDAEEQPCPACLGRSVNKLLSTFAVSAGGATADRETGPCHCGAPRRGMCGES